MSVNKVILVGNAGKDPEVKYLENSTPVCNLTLATNEIYTNKSGEKVKNTEWHNIVLWRSLAEIAQKYVKKGTQVYIEGKIRTRSYDDKDGNKKYITEIVADNMQLLGHKPEGGNNESSQESKSSPAEYNTISPSEPSDDLPF
jgi:single-strand DNA-binding protein